MTQIYAFAFMVLAPFVVLSARFTIALYRSDRDSGVALALAWVTSAGALIAVFLGLVSWLYVLGARELVVVLSPAILPSFLGLEILTIIVPTYLSRRDG